MHKHTQQDVTYASAVELLAEMVTEVYRRHPTRYRHRASRRTAVAIDVIIGQEIGEMATRESVAALTGCRVANVVRVA